MPFIFLIMVGFSSFLGVGIVMFGTEDIREHGIRMQEEGYSRGVQDMAAFMTSDIKKAHECLNVWMKERSSP